MGIAQEKEKERERERKRERERETHAHTHRRVHAHTCTRTHIHPCQTHTSARKSVLCKPVCDSVHVRTQAMNPINPGVKWWKELCLIAFFGWLTVVELYAIFVGFHNTYTGDSRTFVTFHGGTPGVSETLQSR